MTALEYHPAVWEDQFLKKQKVKCKDVKTTLHYLHTISRLFLLDEV